MLCPTMNSKTSSKHGQRNGSHMSGPNWRRYGGDEMPKDSGHSRSRDPGKRKMMSRCKCTKSFKVTHTPCRGVCIYLYKIECEPIYCTTLYAFFSNLPYRPASWLLDITAHLARCSSLWRIDTLLSLEEFRVLVYTGVESQSNRSSHRLCNLALVDWPQAGVL
jgi:hypothetical protein